MTDPHRRDTQEVDIIDLWAAERGRPPEVQAHEKQEAGTIYRRWCAEQDAKRQTKRRPAKTTSRRDVARQPAKAVDLGPLFAIVAIIIGLLALCAHR